MDEPLAEHRRAAGKPVTLDELQNLADEDLAYWWLLWQYTETPSTWAEKYPIEDRIFMENGAREWLSLMFGTGGDQR